MNRRERKKEETRAKIIECAISFFREKGFTETSMEEIAEKADVSKGTLYNYFQDKESILIGYFQTVVADYGKQINESLTIKMDIEERLFNFLTLISQVIHHDQRLAIIYFKTRMQEPSDINLVDNSKRSGIEKWALEMIKKAQDDGQLRNDIPALILTRNFQFLVRSFFISNLYMEEPFEIDRIKNQLISLFLNGAKS
jgi:AcrR family transcriptional regulator